MIITNELLAKAETLQKEAQDLIGQLKKHNPNATLSHQDYLNSYLFIKLAYLEEQIKEANSRTAPQP